MQTYSVNCTRTTDSSMTSRSHWIQQPDQSAPQSGQFPATQSTRCNCSRLRRRKQFTADIPYLVAPTHVVSTQHTRTTKAKSTRPSGTPHPRNRVRRRRLHLSQQPRTTRRARPHHVGTRQNVDKVDRRHLTPVNFVLAPRKRGHPKRQPPNGVRRGEQRNTNTKVIVLTSYGRQDKNKCQGKLPNLKIICTATEDGDKSKRQLDWQPPLR